MSCCFVMPGTNIEDIKNGIFDYITSDVDSAIANMDDHLYVIAHSAWVPYPYDEIEAARLRDLSRVIAHAKAISSKIEFQNLHGRCDAETILPLPLSFYFKGNDDARDLPLNLFSSVSQNRSTNSIVVDLTGRGRQILWGPHLSLYPGYWGIKLKLEIKNYSSERYIDFAWGDMSTFSIDSLRFESSGIYEVMLHHDWCRTDLCELRIVLPVAAFQGQMTLKGATLIVPS